MRIIFLYSCSLNREDKRDNYGDVLSKYIVKKLSKSFVVKVKYPSSRFYNFFVKNYSVIGSIITAASVNTIVWGSGIIKKNENIRKAKFLAVRGPRTRKRIMELGYEVPEVYGDPAILLPLLFENKTAKKFQIGIIPHYVDYEEVNEFYKNDSRIKVIDLLTFDVEQTTVEILECEQIVSSSLHGVIVSQAYNIPALWVKFSDKLSGDNVKFYDYFESLNMQYNKEFSYKVTDLTCEQIKILLSEEKDILLPKEEIVSIRRKELLSTCPFTK